MDRQDGCQWKEHLGIECGLLQPMSKVVCNVDISPWCLPLSRFLKMIPNSEKVKYCNLTKWRCQVPKLSRVFGNAVSQHVEQKKRTISRQKIFPLLRYRWIWFCGQWSQAAKLGRAHTYSDYRRQLTVMRTLINVSRHFIMIDFNCLTHQLE